MLLSSGSTTDRQIRSYPTENRQNFTSDRGGEQLPRRPLPGRAAWHRRTLQLSGCNGTSDEVIEQLCTLARRGHLLGSTFTGVHGQRSRFLGSTGIGRAHVSGPGGRSPPRRGTWVRECGSQQSHLGPVRACHGTVHAARCEAGCGPRRRPATAARAGRLRA